MSYIQIEHVSKIYETKDKRKQYALKNVFLHLPPKGLVSIVGKSGSGKSTLLNIISLLDIPTSGKVFVNNENILNYEKKEIENYHKNQIGMIFQHYHLLENETVLFNLMLPSLINGQSKKQAKKRALELLKNIYFDKHLLNHKCQDLSGGEKERVAVLRALVNDPPIILADEPTGALDSKNSVQVMNILKQQSLSKLVIVVTHNSSLANQFSDRIIEIKDGNIIKDNLLNELTFKGLNNKKRKNGKNSSWSEHLSFSNFKRKIKRNLISISALVVGLLSSLFIIGFSNGYKESIFNETKKQFDYGSLTITKESVTELSNSPLSLVKMTRPSEKEINSLQKDNPDFIFTPNFDYIFSSIDISVGEENVSSLSVSPIYSFKDLYIDSDLLIEGKIPKYDSLIEAVINVPAYSLLNNLFGYSPIGKIINMSNTVETSYLTSNSIDPYVYDYFAYSKNVKIVGVVDCLDFLSTPKIYYSYSSLIEYLEETKLNNLSSYLGYDVSWYQRISDSYNNEELSSYSYRMFLKNYQKINLIDQFIDKYSEVYSVECPSLTIKTALLDLISAAKIGMSLFLVIAILGTALILGILSFSSYSEDRKTSAILSSLGANKNDIFNIYLYENLLLGIIALVISIFLSIILEKPANILLYKITGFSNLICIPLLAFKKVKFSLPILLICATFIICYFSSYFPISLSKKISIKEELKDE